MQTKYQRIFRQIMLGVLDKSKTNSKNIWNILDKYRSCQHQLEPGMMCANQILTNIFLDKYLEYFGTSNTSTNQKIKQYFGYFEPVRTRQDARKPNIKEYTRQIMLGVLDKSKTNWKKYCKTNLDILKYNQYFGQKVCLIFWTKNVIQKCPKCEKYGKVNIGKDSLSSKRENENIWCKWSVTDVK